MIRDMTKGSTLKNLLYFAIPMILGNMFQQLYNIIDSIIVGRYVGAEALAAVGAAYPIVFVTITVANGASIGCSVVVSQYFGAKEIHKMKESIYTAILSIIIVSIAVLILGTIFSLEIVTLMNTPLEIIKDTYNYLFIYFCGVIFLFTYNIATSLFNALGNSKTPLLFLIFSSIINVILDLIFVLNFNMGVTGVAIATLISQGISAILSMGYLLIRLRKIKLNDDAKYKIKIVNFSILKSMGKIAIPSILQQSIVSIGNLFVQALVNTFGSIVIAGYTVATKIDSIIILPMANMSNAISTFTAQNIGAKKFDRVKEGYKVALKIILIICVVAAIIIFFLGNNIINLFINKDTNIKVVEIGHSYLKVVSLFYFFMGLMVITNGILRAAGDMNFFLGSTMTNLGSRIIFAYSLSMFIGVRSIWWAVPCGWILASTVSVIRYRTGRWKEKRII